MWTAFALFLVAGWLAVVAARHVSEEGRGMGAFFVFTGLTHPRFYTPRGWRYRKLCLACQLLAVLLLVFVSGRIAPRFADRHHDQPSNDR